MQEPEVNNPNSNQELGPDEYECRDGTGNAGQLYERKLAALIAIRLCQNCEGFYLASNYRHGAGNDDLVFSVERGGRKTAYFIQAKHKLHDIGGSPLSAKIFLGNKFGIRNQFNSFKQIREKVFEARDSAIFENTSNIKYYLYTNRLLGYDMKERRQHETDDDDDVLLLSTNLLGSHIYLDRSEDEDLCAKFIADDLCDEFLRSFVLYAGQASEDELEILIKKEIEKKFPRISTVESWYVYFRLLDFVAVPPKARKTKFVTKETLENTLQVSIEDAKGDKNEVDVSFEQQFLMDFGKKIIKGSLSMITSESDDTSLCRVALKQYFTERTYAYSLKQLQNPSIQQKLKEEAKDGSLIVNGEVSLGVDVNSVFRFISALHRESPEMTIIIATSKKNSAIVNLGAYFKIRKIVFDCTLTDISEKSRRHLLARIVTFQGQNIPLGLLITKLDGVLNEVGICELIKRSDLSVGGRPPEVAPYYLERNLKRNTKLNSSSIRNIDDRSNIKYVISNMTLKEAQDYFELLSSDRIVNALSFEENDNAVIFIMNDEENLSQTFDSMSIVIPNLHWLHHLGGDWYWKKSSGNMKHILDYIDKRASSSFTTAQLLALTEKSEDKIKILSAEPGMGKSTLIDFFAQEMKRLYPKIFLISLRLSDFTDTFGDKHFEKNLEKNVMNLLARAAGVNSAFSRQLFDHHYTSGRMAVFLDGFDEMIEERRNQVVSMLELLKRKVGLTWVSTRPKMLDKLRAKLSTLHYSIEPFNSSHRKEFLYKYWKSQHSDLHESQLSRFIDRFLMELEKTLGNAEFHGNALQIKIIADTYSSKVRSYDGEAPIFPEGISLLQIYKSSIREKLEIVIEKCKAKNLHSSHIKAMKKAEKCVLTDLALLTLLSKEKCLQLFPSITESKIEGYKTRIDSEGEIAGIVLSYKRDTPQFLHTSYAEYLTAKFIIKNFEQNKMFVSSEIMTDEFYFVRYFIEIMLAADQTTLGGGGDCSPGFSGIIFSLSRAGTAATYNRCFHPIEQVIKSRSILNVAPFLNEENVLLIPKHAMPICRLSLKIAVWDDSVKMLLYLLSHDSPAARALFGKDTLPTYKWVRNDDCEGFTLLHLAAGHDACKILSYLLEPTSIHCKEELKYKRDVKGRTAFDVAKEYENKEAMTLLSDSNSCITL